MFTANISAAATTQSCRVSNGDNLLMRRTKILASILAMLAVTLGGCGRSETYRYKLTLSVDTPDGVKTAFNVVEVRHAAVSLPARGVNTRVKGEALYLDLGPGKRPLIALLTKRLPDNIGPSEAMRWRHWGGDAPTTVLGLLNGEKFPLPDMLDYVARFRPWRGQSAITTADLPDLVTFSDISEPASVTSVDPDDLSATLGDGVSWKSVTLEVTNDVLTSGIERQLPWLPSYFDKLLDGRKPGQRGDGTLASRMNTASFQIRGF
jgi:hypothetical protein